MKYKESKFGAAKEKVELDNVHLKNWVFNYPNMEKKVPPTHLERFCEDLCAKFSNPKPSSVSIDREKLAMQLFGYNILVSGVTQETILHHWKLFESKDRYYSMADALIAHKSEWITIK